MRLTNMLALAATVTLAATLSAQVAPDPTFMLSGPPLQMRTGSMSMRMETMDAAPVKGAPFCAMVSTEHTQILSDGNRIHTTDNSTLCRDSEGRTRREASLNLMGAAAQTSAPKLITIVDPVGGVRYLLDTTNKVAHKMSLKPGGPDGPPPDGPAGPGKERFMIIQRSGGSGPDLFFNDAVITKDRADSTNPPATENLGDQTINGIHATGTRVTTTIPAGKMGNEKPIVVTSERWYSPELQATVMTKHNDPWSGELKTEFTNVNTAEPDASRFTVPSDYKIVDDKNGPMRLQFRDQLPPPPPPQ
ncbi:MAG: hypothetical protein WAM79_07860 [Candidatus Sulfotelmatobacter sp.]